MHSWTQLDTAGHSWTQLNTTTIITSYNVKFIMTFENVNKLINSKRNKRLLVTFGIFTVLLLLIPPMYTLDVPNAYAAKPVNDCEEFDPDGVDFTLEEASIADIHDAILAGEITSLQLVCLYFDRIKAYSDEQCVTFPDGFTGPTFTTSLNAGSVNGYNTLNLRPDARENLGFDERKDRTQTDPQDNNAKMPDALEVAAALDAEFDKTGVLVGPLHGIPIAIKDQVDTFDMRTTTGDDAFYDEIYLVKDSYVELYALSKAGNNLVDLKSGTEATFLGIRLISKEGIKQ